MTVDAMMGKPMDEVLHEDFPDTFDGASDDAASEEPELVEHKDYPVDEEVCGAPLPVAACRAPRPPPPPLLEARSPSNRRCCGRPPISAGIRGQFQR